jgi:hypothetical protein
MKKISVMFFALTTLGCAVAFGGPGFSESRVAVVKNGDVFKVIYQGSVESMVKITIFTADNQAIFSEKIVSSGKFVRPYNFSHLPKGDYKICVDDQNGQHVEKRCNTETGEIDQMSGRGNTCVSHVVKLKDADNKYLVSIPQQGEAAVEIRIYDQNRQLVFSETLSVDRDFAKVYTIKNLEDPAIEVVKLSSGREKLPRVE